MCVCNVYIYMGIRFILIERNNEMKINLKDLIIVKNYCFCIFFD